MRGTVPRVLQRLRDAVSGRSAGSAISGPAAKVPPQIEHRRSSRRGATPAPGRRPRGGGGPAGAPRRAIGRAVSTEIASACRTGDPERGTPDGHSGDRRSRAGIGGVPRASGCTGRAFEAGRGRCGPARLTSPGRGRGRRGRPSPRGRARCGHPSFGSDASPHSGETTRCESSTGAASASAGTAISLSMRWPSRSTTSKRQPPARTCSPTVGSRPDAART